MNDFKKEVAARITAIPANNKLCETAAAFMLASTGPQYSYNFAWQGRPIIQYPQDIVAVQELIWQIKPDLIIETGIAHGGSLIFSASMLALLDMCDGPSQKSRHLKSLKYAFTLGNEHVKLHQSPKEARMH